EGGLRVGREEQRWRNRAVLFLDTRLTAHGGRGPASSFEYAVSAAASIGVHLAREEMDTEFVTDAGKAAAPGSFEDVLLDTLAVIRPSRNASLSSGLAPRPGDPRGLAARARGFLARGPGARVCGGGGGGGAGIGLAAGRVQWARRPPGLGRRGQTRRGSERAHGGRVASGHGDRRHAVE